MPDEKPKAKPKKPPKKPPIWPEIVSEPEVYKARKDQPKEEKPKPVSDS